MAQRTSSRKKNKTNSQRGSRRTPNKSDAQKYFEEIDSGRIITSTEMKRLAAIMLPRYKAGKYKRWHFDINCANRPISFIEDLCKLPSGKLGSPFKLELFQRAFIQTVFGWVDKDGNRQFREVINLLGRKNGKTSIGAGLELYMLVGDNEGAPQVYNVASSRDQASLAYGAALKMMRQSPGLSEHLRKGIVPERDADGIMCDFNMGYITVLSGQTRHLDGLDVHFALIDELAAITNRDLYDLVKQGMSAREQPLLMVISTEGFLRGGIFDAQMEYSQKWLKRPSVDDNFIPFIYKLDKRAEWEDEKTWIKANPGLGTIKKKEALRGYVKKAKNDPEFLPTVLTKDFNLPENAAQAWLTYKEAVNPATFELKGFDYCILGFDASDTTDLTAASALMMREGDEHIYEMSMYWLPEDTITLWSNDGRRTQRDDAPYEQWIKRGLLRTVPGNKIDKHVVVEWIHELRSMGIYTYAVGYDPWHVDDSTLRDMKMAVGDSRCFVVRQGAATLSQPMKQIRAEYRANNIIDNHNPINEWCRMNVSVKTDINDNIQPVKKMNNPKNRIDGFIAEICAYKIFCDVKDDYQALVG